MAHTNGIESVWSMVKRGYEGIYHHMSEQQLHRYLYEFGGRARSREFDTDRQMGHLAKNMKKKRLKYTDLVQDGYWAKKS